MNKKDIKWFVTGVLHYWASGTTRGMFDEDTDPDYQDEFLNRYESLIQKYVRSGRIEDLITQDILASLRK